MSRWASGRCYAACGLNDSWVIGFRFPSDHHCLLPDFHEGPHEFIGPCGRTQLPIVGQAEIAAG